MMTIRIERKGESPVIFVNDRPMELPEVGNALVIKIDLNPVSIYTEKCTSS